MAVNALGEWPDDAGGPRFGGSLWITQVSAVAATSAAVTTPFTHVHSAMAVINTVVGTPVSTGTAFVSVSWSGGIVTVASFDDTGAAVNIDKTIELWVIGKR